MTNLRYLLNMQVEMMSRQSDKGIWRSGNGPDRGVSLESPVRRLDDTSKRVSSNQEDTQGVDLGVLAQCGPVMMQMFCVHSAQCESH